MTKIFQVFLIPLLILQGVPASSMAEEVHGAELKVSERRTRQGLLDTFTIVMTATGGLLFKTGAEVATQAEATVTKVAGGTVLALAGLGLVVFSIDDGFYKVDAELKELLHPKNVINAAGALVLAGLSGSASEVAAAAISDRYKSESGYQEFTRLPVESQQTYLSSNSELAAFVAHQRAKAIHRP